MYNKLMMLEAHLTGEIARPRKIAVAALQLDIHLS